MLRRLYLLFPQAQAVQQTVAELQEAGVSLRNLHTIAKEGVDISGLPPATVRQRNDFSARLETIFWNFNLLLFFTALLVLMIALFTSNLTAVILSLVVAFITFMAGHHFASQVPRAHLDECSSAIKHGEILLLVDVPRWKIKEVMSLVHRQHPDMELGGVTWTLQGL